MIGAFLYLSICSIKNRVRVRLRRLRQPRYLIGSAVGILYLYATVFRRTVGRSGRSASGLLPMLDRARGPIEFVGAMVLSVIAAASWILPGGRPIEFTRPEVQFLFQAPLSRRQLLHYKLLRGQIGVLFGSAVATIFLRPGSLATAWTFLVGVWLVLALLRLHLIGVALRRQSLAQHGGSGIRRQWLPAAIVLGAIGVLAVAVASDWSTLSAMTTAEEVFHELQRQASSGAAAVVLWPFRAAVRLPLSGSPRAFLHALPAVLLLLALNYVWVLQGDAAFEEASAAQAEKHAAERVAPGSVRRKAKVTAPPFTLAATGRPEIAIFWKNLIMLGRYASLKMLLRFLPVFVALTVLFSQGEGRAGLQAMASTLCLVFAGFTILLGPQMMRNDLRQDFGNLAVLKTWPLRGAALLRGELLAPSVVLAVLAWCLIVASAIFISSSRSFVSGHWISVTDRVSYAIGALLVAPGLILAQLVVHNAVAVLFPAWVVVGTSRARGIDAMGQRMLMLAGILLALVVSLVPAAVVAGVVGLLLYAITRTIPVIVPAIVIAAVMIAECAIAIEILGRLLDRTDVTALEPLE
jgi:ABC-2 type transport system permease protein